MNRPPGRVEPFGELPGDDEKFGDEVFSLVRAERIGRAAPRDRSDDDRLNICCIVKRPRPVKAPSIHACCRARRRAASSRTTRTMQESTKVQNHRVLTVAAARRLEVAPGVPAFSPHDLRHRRISLLHLGGLPWARIGEHVGQRNLAVTANTYSHVLTDEAELDYGALLRTTAATPIT